MQLNTLKGIVTNDIYYELIITKLDMMSIKPSKLERLLIERFSQAKNVSALLFGLSVIARCIEKAQTKSAKDWR